LKLKDALRSTKSGEPVSERVLRGLWRVGEGAGLVLVFASGSLLALLLYANLPAGKRLLATTLERALSATFYGNFTIDAIDHFSLHGLQARGITVRDPDGRVVITVTALSATADLVGLGRELWLGTGTVTLRIDHTRLERAEVYLMSRLNGDSDAPTIADAFTPLPSETPRAPSAPSSRKLKVWLPEIEVGHIYGRMALGNVPTLETELSTVHGSVLGAADLTTVDVDRFSMLARGIGGADARGVGSVHVRAPGAVWTSFDGYFGEVQLGAVVRVDGPKLAITADVPRADAADVRALWQGYPLQKDVGAHVEAVGTAHSLHTQAKFLIGRGSVDATGEVRLSGDPGADLDISGRALNLQAIWPTVPETQIDADATLSVFESGSELTADVNGSTHETRIAGATLPAIDVTGTYTAKGFDAHATLHEPGVPVKAEFTVHPDGAIDGSAEAKHVDLSRASRIKPYFAGRGFVDLQLKAHIEKNKLDAHVDASVRDFEDGALTFKSSKISGRASGPLAAPQQLALDFSAKFQMLRAGPFGFDELDTTARGPLTRPVVSAVVNNQYGPSISAQATVTTRGAPRLDDLSLRVQRDDAALTAKVAQVVIEGRQVHVNGLSVQGAGGKLEASGQVGPEHLAIKAQGEDLDLEVVAHALGLPRGVLTGKIGLNADVDSTQRAQRGSLILTLDHGQIDGLAVDSARLATQLIGSHLDLQTSAKLRDFGDFVAEARTTLNGSLGDLATLERATGTVTLTGEHMPLGLLSYAIPKSVGVSEMRGEASATLELNRQKSTAIPSVSLLLNTNGLYVALAPKAKTDQARVFDGVDAHAGLNVNGDTGETEVTLKLDDRHGPLLSATTNLTLDLEAATKHPDKLLAQLYTTPLVAKAVIEDRPLEELPAPLVPKGLAGRLRTEASLRGTLERPIFSDKSELYQLRFGDSERDKAIDVCAELDYDKSTGQYGARGELFLPSNALRACRGTRVAQFSGAGRAEWAKLVNPELAADAAWTGTAGLSLEGLPLDIVPALAEAGFDGKVLGAVMFDRRQALPQMFAHLEVRDAVVARTPLGRATIQARTDGRTLSASVAVAQRLGKLDGDLQTSLNWQGVVPGIDDTRPISAHLNATDIDAVILTPFVHDILSEIGGKLDAKLTATLTPDLDPKAAQHWTGALSGALAMRDGTLQLARLALRMKDVRIAARAEEHANSTLIRVDSLSAAAEGDEANVGASGNIWLQGFQISRGNARVALGRKISSYVARGVPLLIEGVTVATLDTLPAVEKNDVLVELERRPTEMFVGLTIPRLNAELPKSASRTLIGLGSNGDIEIAQPIAEPRKSGDGESLPWRMKFDLGGNVKVTRSDLFLPLTGAPEILLGDTLQVAGNIELIPGGRLNLPGLPRPFTIENGTASFDPDGDPSDPRIRVQAICQTQQVTVRAKVSGTLNKSQIDLEDVDDPSITDPAIILAKLLNTPTDETNPNNAGSPAAAGLGAGAGLLGSQLLANTPLSNLQIKAGSETTADQASYQTYSAAYPISDTVWFEGSYKTLQGAGTPGANTTNAFSGTVDWRFRRNWSLRTELGNIGTGVDLLWQYKY
jgi:TamB, inner membrane protein subunit of TAM complex